VSQVSSPESGDTATTAGRAGPDNGTGPPGMDDGGENMRIRIRSFHGCDLPLRTVLVLLLGASCDMMFAPR